jgi:hypothetical protein
LTKFTRRKWRSWPPASKPSIQISTIGRGSTSLLSALGALATSGIGRTKGIKNFLPGKLFWMLILIWVKKLILKNYRRSIIFR